MRLPGSSYFPLAVALTSVTVLAGCPWTAPTPVARVHHGPGFAAGPRTLAALPVQSTTDDPSLWSPAHGVAVAAATRLMMEFMGYDVIDTELLNAESRSRTTMTVEALPSTPPPGDPSRRHGSSSFWQPPSSPASDDSAMITTDGLAWSSAPPERRLALLAAMGIDGTLATEMAFGRAHGMARQRTVTARLTVARLDGGIVWQSACDVETGDYHSALQAIDLATRCALESASLW